MWWRQSWILLDIERMWTSTTSPLNIDCHLVVTSRNLVIFEIVLQKCSGRKPCRMMMQVSLMYSTYSSGEHRIKVLNMSLAWPMPYVESSWMYREMVHLYFEIFHRTAGTSDVRNPSCAVEFRSLELCGLIIPINRRYWRLNATLISNTQINWSSDHQRLSACRLLPFGTVPTPAFVRAVKCYSIFRFHQEVLE